MPDPHLMRDLRDAEDAAKRAASEATAVLGGKPEERLAVQALAQSVVLIAGARALIAEADE